MCPLFLPAAAVPLTGLFSGKCAAAGNPGGPISADTLRECCNRGYARATCAHAATVETDAARFLIKSDRGGIVEVAWAIERDHHPVQVGTLLISEMDSPSDPLTSQATAHAELYRARKGRL